VAELRKGPGGPAPPPPPLILGKKEITEGRKPKKKKENLAGQAKQNHNVVLNRVLARTLPRLIQKQFKGS